MSHRKREVAHWNVGKGHKGERKAREKIYAKKEIDQSLQEDEEFRYKYSKRTPNKRARLEYRITWYKTLIDSYKHSDAFKSRLRTNLREAEKALADLIEEDSQ